MNATRFRMTFGLALSMVLFACGETLLQATESVEPAVILPTGGSGGADQMGSGGTMSSSGGLGGMAPSSGGSLPVVIPPATPPFYIADDFEQGFSWDIHATEGSVIERVTTRSRSGEHSIRFTQGTKTSESYIKLPIEARENGDRLHVRAWYYVPSGAVNGRVNLVSTNGVTAPDVNLLSNGFVELFLHPEAVRVSTGGAVYPYDRWFCLETGLLVHPSDGELRVTLAGQEVLSTTGKNTTSVSFEYAAVGLTWVEMDQHDAVIYVDDLAVDYLPLPCD